MIQPLKQQVIGNVGQLLWVVMGTIGVVMLIACANVTNLFLVRVEARQPELAVRTALGAGRARIVRGLLVESVMLGIMGGFVGVGLAYAGVQFLIARGQRVKGVTGFMQNRFHIALHADGVHEDERQARFRERGLIATRRFAFAIVEVEQAQVAHGLKAIRQLLVELIEYLLGVANHFFHLLERLQRRTAQRVHRQIPRTKRG